LNPIQTIRLFALLRKFDAITKEKGSFMSKLPQLVHLVITLCGVIGVPALAQSWLSQPGHSAIFIALVCISVVLHALSPSIFAGPSDDALNAAGLGAKSGMILLCALLLGGLLPGRAQTATPATPIQNFYAAGGSYSVNASPSIAGLKFQHLCLYGGRRIAEYRQAFYIDEQRRCRHCAAGDHLR